MHTGFVDYNAFAAVAASLIMSMVDVRQQQEAAANIGALHSSEAYQLVAGMDRGEFEVRRVALITALAHAVTPPV